MREYFNQQFLFNGLPVDKMEFPAVEIQYIKSDSVPIPFCRGLGFENAETSLLLSYLMEITDSTEWEELLRSVGKNRTVFLVDDVPIMNEEVEPYKMFYLKTFYYWLSQNCTKCFVYQVF